MPDHSIPAVRGILFDLDGTLLDTLEDIGRSANEALRALGLPGHDLSAYRAFIGEGVATLFQRALPAELARPETVDRCMELFRETYGRGWSVATRPYDGVPAVLDALADRGLPVGVLSNKPDVFAKLCVEHLLPRWRFVAVCGQREGVPRKPDPTAALELAARLGVEPGAVALVGDTAVDMTTARRSGMMAIGAGWGFRPPDELVAAGASVVLSRPLELLDWLNQ